MQKIAFKNGFSLIRTAEVKEIDATLYELSHDKTGAELIYLEREEENKTFAIAFNTPPVDSTGVFHIIEHSVLCGSEKYPLKDPFAELLKGSLNTFLNAVTYEDRTVYPVSSRCEKDFMNLVSVYLDAVFFPKLLENPSIFNQEGWHYEYDEESDTLSYNGVVYNEMKGAYSSPDDLGAMELSKALYPDTVYSNDSGGNPEEIPALTYNGFKEAYKKHYHPSNSRIVLDGKLDIDATLALINSQLSRFERGTRVNPPQKSADTITKAQRVRYEISENESEKDRAKILFGYVYSDFSSKAAHITSIILADLLCGSNASPLKKALLEKGLCKDAAIYTNKSLEQTVTLELIDTNEECLDEAISTISDVVENLCKNGIDKKQIESIINVLEFKLRERDFGTLPSGISYALSMIGMWSYGGIPENALLVNDVMCRLRENINTDYFEEELKKIFLENSHKACVVMIPDKNLGRENARLEKEKLAKIRASLSGDEINEIIKAKKELVKWQEGEDDVTVLPQLSIADIPTKSNDIKTTVSYQSNVKILENDIKTNGIVYISLYFDTSDLVGSEITELALLSGVLLNLPTKNYSALELQGQIKASLGSFLPSVYSAKNNGKISSYLKVGASLLSSKKDEFVHIIDEVLLKTKFDDVKELKSILEQSKTQIEEGIIASGEALAISRVEASAGGTGNISEFVCGYEAYKVMSKLLNGDISELLERIKSLAGRIFTQNRLTVSVAGDEGIEIANQLSNLFPEGEELSHQAPITCAEKSEFFVTPSKVSYAVLGGISSLAKSNLGLLRVVRSILSYEYLWNTIRVKNGAYGAGFITKKDGFVGFYSYRDPSPALSVECYKKASDYLRHIADTKQDLTKFIIGAIGEYDIILTPRSASLVATQNYLNGWSGEDEAECRHAMLNMSHSDLYLAADIIDEAIQNSSMTIVGSGDHLNAMPTKPQTIITI